MIVMWKINKSAVQYRKKNTVNGSWSNYYITFTEWTGSG
jgi:hypothetical protein